MFKPFIDIYVLQMFICHHNQHVNNIFTELQEKKKKKKLRQALEPWKRHGNDPRRTIKNMHQNASAPSRPRHAQNRSGPPKKTNKPGLHAGDQFTRHANISAARRLRGGRHGRAESRVVLKKTNRNKRVWPNVDVEKVLARRVCVVLKTNKQTNQPT